MALRIKQRIEGRLNQDALFLFFIFMGVAIWIFLFRDFLSGRLELVDDALAYCGHIQFYLGNIAKGIYPLWDPFRDYGTVGEFYLRRIGEFNPVFLGIVFLTKLGIGFTLAYRIFLGVYFLLGMAGFYLLCQRMFENKMVSCSAVLLLMFSSLGGQPFESYLMLSMIPALWFLYFLMAFFQTPRKSFMVGATFSLMLVLITYIPFYTITVLMAGAASFGIIYFRSLKDYCGKGISFMFRQKKWVAVCCILLILSLIPGLLWQRQAQQGEVVAQDRHIGSQFKDTATLPIERINEGGIIAPVIFNQIFSDLKDVHLNDFYIPLFVFLVLLVGGVSLINRRIVFLFVWGFVMFLVGIADASCVHKFLFDHIFFFKYFRNLHIFLYLAVLPILILFVSELFKSILNRSFSFPYKCLYTAYVILVHAGVAVFFMYQDSVIISTYLTIIVSAVFFLWIIWRKNVYVGFTAALLFVTIVIQPFQVYGHLNQCYVPSFIISEYKDKMILNLPEKDLSLEPVKVSRDTYRPYFAIKSAYLLKQLKPDNLIHYMEAKIILYDRLAVMDEAWPDLERINQAFANFENIAFIPTEESNRVRLSNGNEASNRARVITRSSPEVKIEYFDVNRVSLRTILNQDKFLVYNDGFHSQWRVYVDGKQMPLIRANVNFKGVWVPAGEHMVTFKYAQWWRYVLGYFFVFLFLGVFIYLIRLLVKKI